MEELKYSPIGFSKTEYKELIKIFSQRYPLYDIQYSNGYVRALYDHDLITKNQWSYLLRVIKKYGV